jgi:NitT/TauT family transport system permease protein
MTVGQRVRQLQLGTAGFLMAILMWEATAHIFGVLSPQIVRFFPPPTAVFEQARTTLTQEQFWSSLNVTNTRVIEGFCLGVFLATPLGLLLSRWRTMDALLSPVLDFGRYVPIPALVPLTILWVGIGESQKVLVLFLGTFFQHFVLTLNAARRVPPEHIETALTLGASKREVLISVILPASMPDIYDAARVSMSQAWSYVLVAELVASQNGIGYSILRAERFLQTDQIMVAVIILGLVGLAYDRLFTTGRHVFFRWAPG